jgi:hypothetical protein
LAADSPPHGQDARATPLRLRIKKPEPPKPFAFFAAITVAIPKKNLQSVDSKTRATLSARYRAEVVDRMRKAFA